MKMLLILKSLTFSIEIEVTILKFPLFFLKLLKSDKKMNNDNYIIRCNSPKFVLY